MTVLSSKRVLEDKQTRNPEAITALALTHKALTDVSCLSEFKNLERLDVSVNNLTSLEGLRSCVNLKWLSVVQNKLQSLKGIGGLTKLTVLNAGKNKLKSMDDVRSLISLRALILNDNEIVTICRLDQMKELNTLVLSRNPISKIGESLGMVKSITKASLSNCHIESIDSLKSCTELKELRLAHNDIKTLPSELVHNTKLQLLDAGNNSITSWSDIKVLSRLINLTNLNLQGNPIAEKDKLAKKIRKLVPNLQIFNSKPIDQSTKNENGERDDTVGDYPLKKEGKIEQSMTKSNSKHKGQENEDDKAAEFTNPFFESQLKRKKDKTSQILKAEEDGTETGKELKWKSKREKLNDADVIDDGETPFADLFATTGENTENRFDEKVVEDVINGLNTFPVKSKKIKLRAKSSALQLRPAVEVGLGGPSMWDEA